MIDFNLAQILHIKFINFIYICYTMHKDYDLSIVLTFNITKKIEIVLLKKLRTNVV
jgi:hypothetical protein